MSIGVINNGKYEKVAAIGEDKVSVTKLIPNLDYTNAVTISSVPYTAPSDGIAMIGFTNYAAGVYNTITRVFYVNDIEIGGYASSSGAAIYYSTPIFLGEGDVLNPGALFTANGNAIYKFIPFKTE